MAPHAHRRANRPAYLAVAALFISFLAYSAPHRVHHIFEHSHDARPAPCQALTVAKSCPLAVAATIVLAFEQNVADSVPTSEAVSIPQRSLSSVSQRAPPLA
jgi:hypothetical protein